MIDQLIDKYRKEMDQFIKLSIVATTDENKKYWIDRINIFLDFIEDLKKLKEFSEK